MKSATGPAGANWGSFEEGSTTASAKALRVAPQGADYKSIQAAIDAARPGAEIVVDSGTYTESLWIAKPRLTLRSATRHGAKIVAPPKRDAIGLGEGANYITLDGFDITAPGGNGIQTNRTGIEHILNHHTIVRNCYIHDCGGGGIQLNHGDYRTVEHNVVRHCATTGPWGQSGISLWQAIALDREPGFHIVVRGNILWNNSNPPKGTDGNGLIIDDFRNTQHRSTNGVYPNKTLVENNVVYQNGARGIHVFLSDHVVVRNNTAYHNNWDDTNDATWRGELSCVNSSDVNWYNNVAVASSAMNVNNTAMVDGGGNQGTEWAGNLFFDSDKPKERAGNNFPISHRLGNSPIVPLGEKLVEHNLHGLLESCGILPARLVHLVKDAHLYLQAFLRFSLRHVVSNGLNRVEDHSATRPGQVGE